jgi:hypothetical protein
MVNLQGGGVLCFSTEMNFWEKGQVCVCVYVCVFFLILWSSQSGDYPGKIVSQIWLYATYENIYIHGYLLELIIKIWQLGLIVLFQNLGHLGLLVFPWKIFWIAQNRIFFRSKLVQKLLSKKHQNKFLWSLLKIAVSMLNFSGGKRRKWMKLRKRRYRLVGPKKNNHLLNCWLLVPLKYKTINIYWKGKKEKKN